MSMLVALTLAAGGLLADLRSDPLARKEACDIAVRAALARLQRRPAPRVRYRSRALGLPGGAFVTVVHGQHVRGCWGSIFARRPDLAGEIAAAAAGAMDADYRHRPVNLAEWGELRLIVSVVGPLRLLRGGERTDPLAEGIYVTAGSRGGVLLPGEARSHAYQRRECERKAGIAPGSPAAAYAFETWRAEADTRRLVP